MELKKAIEKKKLRQARPIQAKFLERTFDIDAEAEWLDWMDERELNKNGTYASILANENKKGTTLNWCAEGIVHAVKWSSIGWLEIWEGRALLYIEGLLKNQLDHVDKLYENDTWSQLKIQIEQISEQEAVESVMMSWMRHRESLGETLDEKKDPKILPTIEAHDRSVRAIHRLLRHNIEGTILMIGREHLPYSRWRLGGILISKLLENETILRDGVITNE